MRTGHWLILPGRGPCPLLYSLAAAVCIARIRRCLPKNRHRLDGGRGRLSCDVPLRLSRPLRHRRRCPACRKRSHAHIRRETSRRLESGRYRRGGPRQHQPGTGLVISIWRYIICVAVLGYVNGLSRVLCRMDAPDGVVMNAVLAAGLMVAAMLLLLAWETFGQSSRTRTPYMSVLLMTVAAFIALPFNMSRTLSRGNNRPGLTSRARPGLFIYRRPACRPLSHVSVRRSSRCLISARGACAPCIP